MRLSPLLAGPPKDPGARIQRRAGTGQGTPVTCRHRACPIPPLGRRYAQDDLGYPRASAVHISRQSVRPPKHHTTRWRSQRSPCSASSRHLLSAASSTQLRDDIPRTQYYDLHVSRTLRPPSQKPELTGRGAALLFSHSLPPRAHTRYAI